MWSNDVPQAVRTTQWGPDSLLNKKQITVQIESITPLYKFSDLYVSKFQGKKMRKSSGSVSDFYCH